jgi:hypothetical protein
MEGDMFESEVLAAAFCRRLERRNDRSRVLRDYYEGRHPEVYAHKKAAAPYARLLAQASTNFPLLVVDSVTDRLIVQGFRLDGQDADERVWTDIWQRNNLDIYSSMTHVESLVHGISYVSVWPGEDGYPVIRGEATEQVWHDSAPGEPMRTRRALKAWPDPVEGKWFARLFTDTDVVFLEARADVDGDGELVDPRLPQRWTQVGSIGNPFGIVPIVPFINRPRFDGSGFSEIGDLLPVFDRVNTLTAQLLLASELSAFKIRWATGMMIPSDPTTGQPVEPFNVAMDRLWVNENEQGRFGDFGATPLEPFAAAIDQGIQQIAAISRTPPSLLLGKITNLSAEALKATVSGLVQKVKTRQRVLGEAWETVIRLGLMVLGDDRANLVDTETIWADPENVSEAARVDALSKLYALGLPWQAVMERWGASPQEINRWIEMRSDDMFQRAMLESAKTAPVPGLASFGGEPGVQG